MLTSWDIYWITRLDGVAAIFEVFAVSIGVCLATVACLSFIIVSDKYDDSWKRFMKHFLIGIFIWMPFLVGSIMIPSTKEFAAIYLIPKIANNEQMQKVPENVVKLLNGKLEDWISDLAGKKDKK